MPYHKINAQKQIDEFLKKNPEMKAMSESNSRYYGLRKQLVQYREFTRMSLEDVSNKCNLSIRELRNIETGVDESIVHFLTYAQVIGINLNLQA